VTDLRVEADPETGEVRVKAGVSNGRNRAALAHAEAEITGPGGALALRLPLGELCLEPGANATLQAAGKVDSCQPWSPADPALYRIRVLVRDEDGTVDADERTFGFRRLAAAPDGLRLNGEPIFLTGFNRHEDSPRTAMAEDRPLTRRDLEQMKEAGANFVRLCHYPHAPAELGLCDSLGLVALAEIPLYFWNNAESGRLNQEARTKRAASQLERMIARDAHHASVLFWSVSNETYDPLPEVAESNRQLIRLARSLDATRLAVHVSNHWRTNPAFEEDDVICVNAYPGIDMRICGRGPGYDVAKAAAHWRLELGKLHARFPNKPILITEFGSASFEGTRGHLYGEDRHAAIVQSEFEAFDAPYVCGAAIWCWADHAWPPGRFFGGVPVSPYGVLTQDRRPKAAFHAAREMFRRRQGLPDLPEPVAGEAETKTDFR
jgi:beta-glucuronidase